MDKLFTRICIDGTLIPKFSRTLSQERIPKEFPLKFLCSNIWFDYKYRIMGVSSVGRQSRQTKSYFEIAINKTDLQDGGRNVI